MHPKLKDVYFTLKNRLNRGILFGKIHKQQIFDANELDEPKLIKNFSEFIHRKYLKYLYVIFIVPYYDILFNFQIICNVLLYCHKVFKYTFC